MNGVERGRIDQAQPTQARDRAFDQVIRESELSCCRIGGPPRNADAVVFGSAKFFHDLTIFFSVGSFYFCCALSGLRFARPACCRYCLTGGPSPGPPRRFLAPGKAQKSRVARATRAG